MANVKPSGTDTGTDVLYNRDNDVHMKTGESFAPDENGEITITFAPEGEGIENSIISLQPYLSNLVNGKAEIYYQSNDPNTDSRYQQDLKNGNIWWKTGTNPYEMYYRLNNKWVDSGYRYDPSADNFYNSTVNNLIDGKAEIYYQGGDPANDARYQAGLKNGNIWWKNNTSPYIMYNRINNQWKDTGNRYDPSTDKYYNIFDEANSEIYYQNGDPATDPKYQDDLKDGNIWWDTSSIPYKMYYRLDGQWVDSGNRYNPVTGEYDNEFWGGNGGGVTTGYSIELWVDQIGGADTNDGLTATTPLKTYRKAFQLADGSHNLRINLLSDYTMNKNYNVNVPFVEIHGVNASRQPTIRKWTVLQQAAENDDGTLYRDNKNLPTVPRFNVGFKRPSFHHYNIDVDFNVAGTSPEAVTINSARTAVFWPNAEIYFSNCRLIKSQNGPNFTTSFLNHFYGPAVATFERTRGSGDSGSTQSLEAYVIRAGVDGPYNFPYGNLTYDEGKVFIISDVDPAAP